MRKALTWSLVLALAMAAPAFAVQAPAAKSAQAKAPAAQVNINTASEKELETLPGIGPATAKKIIAGRPYARVDDLAKAGVPKSEIEKIASMVTVGTPAPSTAAKPAPAAPAPTTGHPAPSAQGGGSGTPAPTTAKQPPVKGMVWVNLSTGLYHKEGDRYYGNTKNGKFMTEADAIKAGYHEAKTPTKEKK